MKLSTYHKMLGDNVTFYKGNFKDFIAEELYSELLDKLVANDVSIDWCEHKKLLTDFITRGQQKDLNKLRQISDDTIIEKNLLYFKEIYRKKEYLNNPKWDRVCISTLFTFYWKETMSTINFFKKMCKSEKEVWVGGVAATVMPEEVFNETGIKPVEGLLDKAGIMDNNEIVIDLLPLDYSILNEIDYKYPESNGYYGYMTRGCTNKCTFCAVPKIEPDYNNYISIKVQIDYVKENFGEKQNLLLLDNNVLASDRFNEIIDEIKACGFVKNSKYIPINEYEMAIKGLRSNYNDKGYIKQIIKLYKNLMPKLKNGKQQDAFFLLKEEKLTSEYTAEKEKILELDEYFAPLFNSVYKPVPRMRTVDFNQGLDARLLTREKAEKISEIPIVPLRIAFDSWKYRDTYEKAVRVSAEQGIKHMSNYLLYNYEDDPLDLYYRLKLNVELCEELNISIYSFPMKYHPIQDLKYFKNRTYIGKHWNRKFIRSIQAILNSTKGKIGKGKQFFEEAFGSNEKEFEKLLYMPEALIVYRFFYKKNGTTNAWWNDFTQLNEKKLVIAKKIIHMNNFDNINELSNDAEVLHVLNYYKISRDEAEKAMKQ